MEPTQLSSPAAENATAETTNFSPDAAASTETSATPDATTSSVTEAATPDAVGPMPTTTPDAAWASDGADETQPSTPDSGSPEGESGSGGSSAQDGADATENTASAEASDAPAENAAEASGGESREEEGADSAYIADVHTWWALTAIPGKESAELRADGSLYLRASGSVSERHLGNLRTGTKEATVKALTDKHDEVVARVEELRNEWEAAEDKSKLEGRVSRLREYLQHAISLGDYEPLLAAVSGWEAGLAATREARAQTKAQLVEEAEAIAEGTDWRGGTVRMREIGERFREAGSGGAASADELRSRLEAARDKFFDRKRTAQEEEEKEALRALDLKLEIVDEAENLAKSEAWRQTTEAYKALLDRWKSAGRAGGDRAEDLWRRFTAAQNAFFDRKRAHYKSIQKEQDENMRLKEELIARAEAMQDSTDWGSTAKAYADLMEEWKGIGRVPEEKKEELWGRFAAAKEKFFAARRAVMEGERVVLADNYARKKALLSRAETLRDSTEWREATAEFTELMEEWKSIGPVPREHSRSMWQQFIAARTEFFRRKDADRDRRKERAVGQQQARHDQTRAFLRRVEEELAEEADRLQDFRLSLENVGTGPKSAELTAHLTKLIEQTEVKVKRKEEKVAEVRRQLADLEKQNKRSEGRTQEGGRRETKEGKRHQGGGGASLLPTPALTTSTAPGGSAEENNPVPGVEDSEEATPADNRGADEFAPEPTQPAVPDGEENSTGDGATSPATQVTIAEGTTD